MIKLLERVSRETFFEENGQDKLLINTINAWSYVVAQGDEDFAEALRGGDVLIPDGKSIVWACRFLKMDRRPKERIAGWDLFRFEMERVNREAMESGGGERKRVMKKNGLANAHVRL